MRIGVLTWMRRPPGGVGTYLDTVLPALARHGHEVATCYEIDGPPGVDGPSRTVGAAFRRPIAARHAPSAPPDESASWSIQTSGLDRALHALRDWRPDVLFNQGLIDPGVETAAIGIAPPVFLAHTYYGTCISGAKMFKRPSAVPCSRTFGAPCLVQYYPRRCGGWSPVTMVREFRRQARRLDLLRRYRAIATLSAHMADEYARHGLAATCIGCVVEPPGSPDGRTDEGERGTREDCRLLFASRMDALKGGAIFLDALPHVASALRRPLTAVFAGDGPMRPAWQTAAAALGPGIRVEFTGWLDRQDVGRLMTTADLLVVPSTWPEPAGLVGLEAACRALPAAAFAVGGITDWLRPGVNGHLAPADPPTPAGLAAAIVACLSDVDVHARLRDGARRIAAEYTPDRHVAALVDVLRDAAGRRARLHGAPRGEGLGGP